MSSSEYLENLQREWLESLELTLIKEGHSPEKCEELLNRGRLASEKFLKVQLEHLEQVESRGVPKAIAEEVVALHERITRLEGLVRQFTQK